MQGGWVLVRMKNDRTGGDGDVILSQDRSVASGRTMAAMAAGKGRAAREPTGFLSKYPDKNAHDA